VNLLHQMIAKNPADRPQTPAEVAKALLPFIKPPPDQPRFSLPPVTRAAARPIKASPVPRTYKPCAGARIRPRTLTASRWAKREKDLRRGGPPTNRRRSKLWRRRAVAAGCLVIGVGRSDHVEHHDTAGIIQLEVEPAMQWSLSQRCHKVNVPQGTVEIRALPGKLPVEVRKALRAFTRDIHVWLTAAGDHHGAACSRFPTAAGRATAAEPRNDVGPAPPSPSACRRRVRGRFSTARPKRWFVDGEAPESGQSKMCGDRRSG